MSRTPRIVLAILVAFACSWIVPVIVHGEIRDLGTITLRSPGGSTQTYTVGQDGATRIQILNGFDSPGGRGSLNPNFLTLRVWGGNSNILVEGRFEGPINEDGTYNVPGDFVFNNFTAYKPSGEVDKEKTEAFNKGPGCSIFSPSEWLPMCVLQPLGLAILKLSGWALSLAGVVLNFVVDELVVGMGNLYKNQGVGGGVETAWQTLRNIANSLFIFILLYAAFNTVLGFENGLKLVSRIIVVALLMNFSLLFSQTIIDVSNKMADLSYKQIAAEAVADGSGTKEKTVAGAFISKTQLSTIYKPPQTKGGAAADVANYAPLLTGYNFFIFAVFSSIFLLILAVYFLVLSAMLLARFVVLVILMIVSVLAFLSYLLPAMQNHAKTWWSTLLGQSFFAPAVFLMLYATLKVQKSIFEKFKGNDAQLSDIVTKEADPKILGIIVTMLVLIGLLIASIVLGKKLSNIGSQGIIGIGKKVGTFASGAALGMAGAGLRGSLGRIGSGIAGAQGLNRWADSSNILKRAVAAPLRGIAGTAAKGSFDFRKTRVAGLVGEHAGVDVGKGVKDGTSFASYEKDREKLAEERVKRAAKHDYTDDEKEEMIKAGLLKNGARAETLKKARADYIGANLDVKNKEDRLAFLEKQKALGVHSVTDDVIRAAKSDLGKARKSAVGSAEWTKAQNKYNFGHEDIGNLSQSIAHRATARDWAGHLGGAAAIAGGFALGGVPLGVAALALGGARGFMTLKRYTQNKGGSGHGARGMSAAVADPSYAKAARKAALKVKGQSRFDQLKKDVRDGKILTAPEQTEYDNLRRAFGGGGGGASAGGAAGGGGGGGTP